MARTKGSKNKAKASITQGGNPDFNLNDVEPSQTLGTVVAPGAVLPEDLEFERSLQDIESEMPPIDDPDPGVIVKKVVEKREMLGDYTEDYKPASTDEELRTQVHIAKQEGCDSIEATLKLAKRFCKDPTLEEVGYFWYHDIKIYIVGSFAEAKKRDSMTIEQRMFGQGKKIDRKKLIQDKIRALEVEMSEI